jgi:dipeptidyl aminopeptidase/acylaminoacyl peptidase
VRDAAIDDTQSVDRNGAVVFTGSTGTHPNELYYLPPHAAPRMLTHFNDPVASLNLGRQTEFHWRNGGFDEYGVVTYPPSYDARKRYPLVLRIHGGPTETSTLAFEPFYQLAAARGYIVLAPNYRGSSDDGNAFEYAIYNDASIGPGSDIMAAILALERTNAVDPNRIGVSGWSYGGQLTTWMIARYHIWRAAVTGAGVNDLVVDYAIADDYDDALHAFPGPPHAGRNLAQWRKQSPMSYVESITTPTLILCNVYDVRVPIVESYELYRALRDRAVPVKFYAYPSTGHLPHGPVRLADAYAKWLNWFDRFLHPSR